MLHWRERQLESDSARGPELGNCVSDSFVPLVIGYDILRALLAPREEARFAHRLDRSATVLVPDVDAPADGVRPIRRRDVRHMLVNEQGVANLHRNDDGFEVVQLSYVCVGFPLLLIRRCVPVPAGQHVQANRSPRRPGRTVPRSSAPAFGAPRLYAT